MTTAFVQVALSVTEEIKEVGAYAGIAAILGLAVLSLLYFAQARELKRLRDWAGRAPERAAELEARVQADATKRVVAQPVPQARPAQPATPAAQQQAAAPGASAAAAATPAGAAAKAATPGNGGATPAPAGPPAAAPAQQGAQPADAPGEAKEAQPAATPAPGAQPAPGDQPAATPAAAEAKPAGTPDKPAQQPPAKEPAAQPAGPVPATPAPAPAAAAAAATTGPVTVDPAHDATDRADSARPYVRPPAPATTAAPLRAGSTPSVTMPPRPPAATATRARVQLDSGDEHPLRRNLAIVGGVLGMAIVLIVLVTVVFNGGDDEPPANTISNEPALTEPTDTTATTEGGTSTRPTITRGDVTVAVLNGTTTTGLARAAGNRIQTSGYKLGVVTNAADQQRSATIVSYTAGHRAEALDVARIVKVGADAVQPIDESTQVVAGQEAVVVVTVGADQNT